MGVKGEDHPNVRKETVNNLILSEVKLTNQKPVDAYRLIEKLIPNARYLELFGRKVNVRNNWVTIGDDFYFTPGVSRAEFV